MKSEIEITASGNIRIHISAVLRSRGGQKRIVTPQNGGETPLLTLLARAHAWQKAIDEGLYANDLELARALGLDQSLVARTMRLTRLSPAIVHRIVAGDYPPSMTCASLRKPIPLDWREQERLLLGQE